MIIKKWIENLVKKLKEFLLLNKNLLKKKFNKSFEEKFLKDLRLILKVGFLILMEILRKHLFLLYFRNKVIFNTNYKTLL
jgi:hypothetical protein